MGTSPDLEKGQFDAFISYSREDKVFASYLEKALERYRAPRQIGVTRTRLNIFRDEADLTGVEYFEAISRYVQNSQKLILLCSPAARESQYVADEIRRFAEAKGSQNIIPVLVAGLANNEARIDQAKEMAFPDVLQEVLELPLAVDYRGFNPQKDKINKGTFSNPWYTLLATLYGVSRNEIEQRDLRRKRKQRNFVISIVAAVMVSLATLAAVAWLQKLEADEQRSIALQGLAASFADKSKTLLENNPQSSLLMAIEAVQTTREVDQTHIPVAEQALRDALSQTGGQILRGHTRNIAKFAFGPYDRNLIRLGSNGAEIWDLSQPNPEDQPLWSAEKSLKTALSGDGHWLAIADKEAVRVWDLSNLEGEPTVLGGHGDRIKILALSFDGQWLATADWSDTLRLSNQGNPKAAPRILGEHQRVALLVFSPDGNTLISAARSKATRFWDLTASGIPAKELESPDWEIESAVFSPNSQWLITKDRQGMGRLWHLVDGNPQKTALFEENVRIRGAQFSADSRWLVIAWGKGNLKLWDMTQTPPTSISLPGHEEAVEVLEFSPDSQLLLTAGRETRARVWDLKRPDSSPNVLGEHQTGITEAAFSPKGSMLATATSNTARIWYLRQDDKVAVLGGHAGTIAQMAFSHDGKTLATASEDQEIRLWSTARPNSVPILLSTVRGDPKVRSITRGGSTKWIQGLSRLESPAAFSKNGWFAVTGDDGRVIALDLHRPRSPAIRLKDPPEKEFFSLTFSSDGRWLVVGSENYTVRVWDMNDLAAAPRLLKIEKSRDTSSCSAIAISPDRRWIAAGGGFGKIAVYDRLKPEAGPKMLEGHKLWIFSLEFSRDGRYLLSAGADGLILLWDAQDLAQKPLPIQASQETIRAKFSPDSRWLAAGGKDATVRLWNLHQKNLAPKILLGHMQDVLDFAFSADGKWLVTAGKVDPLFMNEHGEAAHVFLWDLRDDKVPLFKDFKHANSVYSVAFSPDSDWLATGAQDGFLRLWNLRDFDNEPIEFKGYKTKIWWCGFSPDNQWVATVSADDRARIWPLDMDFLISLACQTAGRNMSIDLWQEAQGEKPYRKTCPEFSIHSSVLRKGRLLAKEGKVQRAIALLTRAKKLEPQLKLEPEREAKQLATEEILGKAKQLSRRDKVDAAIAQFELALRIDPTLELDPAKKAQDLAKSRQLEKEAESLAKKGEVKEAVSKYKAAMELDPELDLDPISKVNKLAAPVVMKKATRLAESGQIEKAVETYRKAMDMDPSLSINPDLKARQVAARAQINKAQFSINSGDLDRAIEHFKNAMELDPNLNIDPQKEAYRLGAENDLENGKRLAEKGRVGEAVALFRRAQELNPDLDIDPERKAQFLAAPQIAKDGFNLCFNKKFQQGMEAVSRAFKYDPSLKVQAKCWNQLCWDGSIWWQPAAVMSACQKAVDLEPENGRFRDSRGFARALTGDSGGAIADFQAYLAYGEEKNLPSEDLEKRRQWIKELQAGRNPLTPAILKSMRDKRKHSLLLIPRCVKPRH